MPVYKWICPNCRGAYILPRRSKHQYNHWRCYSCENMFHQPREVGTMGMDDSFHAPLTLARKPQNWKDIVGAYEGPYKFPDSMMMYAERPQGISSKGSQKKKRRRATVIAECDGYVLLIKEKGAHRYSLPGGGIERGESILEAALRELREETKLSVVKAERLFDHEGATQDHKVVWASVRGNVQIQRKELSEYKWWNRKDEIALIDSAKAILSKHRQKRSN